MPAATHESSEQPRGGLRPGWAAGVLLGALLAGIAVWSVGALLVAVGDWPPAGPACDWEMDEGSGPAGTGGREEVRWGYFPASYCVVELDEGQVHEDYLGGAFLTPLAAPVVVVGSWLVGRWALVRFVPSARR